VERNPRYSLRAFGRTLSLHHSTLARLFNGNRTLSRPMIRRVGARLGMTADELQVAITAEDARKVLAAAAAPDFRPDCRWIAMKTGIDVDDINRTLHFLIHQRRLVMSSATNWTIINS
jgi:hypothetical protein